MSKIQAKKIGAPLSGTSQLSNKRKQELARFFGGLSALEDFTSGKTQSLPPGVLSNEFMKIVKASSFLLLYNYIEGCILHSFSSVYEEIQQSKISYGELRAEFQNIWIEYQTKKLLVSPNSSHNTYNETAAQMVNSIIARASITLSRDALPFSGNLNGKKN